MRRSMSRVTLNTLFAREGVICFVDTLLVDVLINAGPLSHTVLFAFE
jgi:hypothetical protein